MDSVCFIILTVAAPLVCMILLPRQVKTVAMSKNDFNKTILAYAALNKSPDVFGAVLSGIENLLTRRQVLDNDDSKLSVTTCSTVESPFASSPNPDVNVTFLINDQYQLYFIV